MIDTYQTRHYTVTPCGDAYEVTDLTGKRAAWVDSLALACELADLYQADDDREAAEEAWNEQHGGEL